jgi:hypothetical protein
MEINLKVKAVMMALGVLLMLPGTSRAIEFEQKVLSGLKGVYVQVAEINREAERLGLSKDKLQTDVELRLRKAGIRVLTDKETCETPGWPFLSVNLNASVGPGICSYAIQVNLYEIVTLERGPKIIGSVWNTGYAGWVGTKNTRQIRGHVDDLVDKFINEYLAANPKK